MKKILSTSRGLCSPRFLFVIFLFALALLSSVSENGMALSGIPKEDARHQENVTVSGWFHIIWNGEPHYILSDADNRTTPLVIDEAALKSAGELRAFNRKKVTIEGLPLASPKGAIRVLSIVPDLSRED